MPIQSRLVVSILFIFGFLVSCSQTDLDSQLQAPVIQEFHYEAPEAGEVFLVWGIDGWNIIPQNFHPEGTIIKDKLMHTPMVREGETFLVQLVVPQGVKIDYGFLITKNNLGEEIQPVWDGEEGYQSTASRDNVIIQQASVTLTEEEPVLNLWQVTQYIIIALGGGFLILWLINRTPAKQLPYIGIIVLVCVLLLGITFRYAGSIEWNSFHPNSAERLIGDETGYDNLAREMLQGHGYTWPGRVPLYPLWLAGVYAISGSSYNAVPYFQIILGLGTILLTFWLGKFLFDLTAGLVAAFWTAGSYILIHQGFHLLSEVLYVPVLLLVALSLWNAIQDPQPRHFIWAGFWIGISNLVRPTLLLFPLVSIFLLIYTLKRLPAIRYWLLYCAISLVVITPWIARNYLYYGAIFPLQTSNAFLWQGSPEYYHLTHDEGYSYIRVWNEILYGPGWQVNDPTSISGDRYWTQRAIRSILSEPLVYLKFAGEKFITLWVGDPSADWADQPIFSYIGLRQIGFSPYDAFQLIVARSLPILALLAIVVLRQRWLRLLPILFLLAYFTIFHALTHAEVRLSEPLQPFLLVLIAGSATHLAERYIRRPGSKSSPYTPESEKMKIK